MASLVVVGSPRHERLVALGKGRTVVVLALVIERECGYIVSVRELAAVVQRSLKIGDIGHVGRGVVLRNGVWVRTIDKVRRSTHRNPDVVGTRIVHIPVDVILRHISLDFLRDSGICRCESELSCDRQAFCDEVEVLFEDYVRHEAVVHSLLIVRVGKHAVRVRVGVPLVATEAHPL